MKSMTAAELREQLKRGEASLRGQGRRRLPERVEEVARRATAPKARGSGGKKTVIDGITFPSRTEARIYLRLKTEAVRDGALLFRQVRYPLSNLAPRAEDGRPLYLTIDFEVAYPDGRRRFIDAKAKRWKSPEWTRGKAAFEARYGHLIEECEA